MLKHSRKLVELHKDRKETRRIWFPMIKLRKWLFSGTKEPESLPAAKRDAYLREGGDPDDDELTSRETLRGRKDQKRKKGVRERVADFLEWASGSDDVLYAFKLTLGVMLVTWPAFVSGWQMWFYHNRGCKNLVSASDHDGTDNYCSMGRFNIYPCFRERRWAYNLDLFPPCCRHLDRVCMGLCRIRSTQWERICDRNNDLDRNDSQLLFPTWNQVHESGHDLHYFNVCCSSLYAFTNRSRIVAGELYKACCYHAHR